MDSCASRVLGTDSDAVYPSSIPAVSTIEMAPHVFEDELIDDSVDETLIVGLKEPLSLKKRFLYRLGHLLETNVEVLETDNVLVVYISPCSVPQNKRQAGGSSARTCKRLCPNL
jgi:hypothetical protein